MTNNPIFSKYIIKLNEINLALDNGIAISDNDTLYLNYYSLLNNLLNEIIINPETNGNKINLITYILKNEKTFLALRNISKIAISKQLVEINLTKFDYNLFCIMLDCYIQNERDSESFDNLLFMLHRNMFLKDLTNKEFIIKYPEVLKQVFNNNLDLAVLSISKILSTEDNSVSVTIALSTLLMYLSSSLELPDVYVYSKKALLELSVMNHDYEQAKELIKDLEDMYCLTPDMKYYKALIAQKEPNNVLYYIKNL